jgi:predicted nuclease with TOPRIM domain
MPYSTGLYQEVEKLEEDFAELESKYDALDAQRRQEVSELEDHYCRLEDEYDSFIAYAEDICPGIHHAFKAVNKLEGKR